MGYGPGVQEEIGSRGSKGAFYYIQLAFLIFKITLAITRNAIEYGWIFLAMSGSGIICFITLAEEEKISTPVAVILSVIASALGIYSMVLKLLWNHKKKLRKLQAEREITDPSPPFELCNTHGFLFGSKHGEDIIKPENSDGHVLVVGGVGSGKSSCIAIPTLKIWKSRVFAIDIKGELYANTKSSRNNIIVFNPQDKNSYGYDPYIFLRNSVNPAQEARAIAQAVIPLPPETQEHFWLESGQTLLTGAILHYFKDFSFIDTLRHIQSNSPRDLVNIIFQNGSKKARLCVSSFIGMDDKTLSGIFAEVSRGIVTLVTDDEIVSALSKDRSITPEDLEYGHDIYIHIPEHLLRQWKNLLTLIVNQFLNFFERRNEENSLTPILFMLDEFARLGKIPAIMDGLATLRSKKISICLIIQSLAQLDMIYGQSARKVISDTCSYKAILGATDADTQEYFSKLVGTYDKKRESHGENREYYSEIGSNKNANTTTEEKRIVKPEEFASLADIILLHPFPKRFCRVEKSPYYVEK